MPLAAVVFSVAVYGLLDSQALHAWYSPLLAIGVIDLVQGVLITSWGAKAGWDRSGFSLAKAAALALLFPLSAAIFLYALPLAPLAPMVAIHMSTPIIYLVWELAFHRRRPEWYDLLVLLLLLGGIFFASGGTSGDISGSAALGFSFALLSSVITATALGLVGQWSKGKDIRFWAGPRALITAALLVPTLFFTDVSGPEIPTYLLLGTLAAPATVLIWWAIPRLPRLLWSGATLTQSFFAAVFAFLLLEKDISFRSAIGAAIILSVVFLETLRHSRKEKDLQEAPLAE